MNLFGPNTIDSKELKKLTGLTLAQIVKATTLDNDPLPSVTYKNAMQFNKPAAIAWFERHKATYEHPNGAIRIDAAAAAFGVTTTTLMTYAKKAGVPVTRVGRYKYILPDDAKKAFIQSLKITGDIGEIDVTLPGVEDEA